MTRQTKTELQAELDKTKTLLETAVKELRDARTESFVQRRRADEFSMAANNLKLQFEGTKLELEKLAQRKATQQHFGEQLGENFAEQLRQARAQITELESHNQILTRMRDDSSNRFTEMRDKIFYLERGLDDRVAAAEGKATYYKSTLTALLGAIQVAVDDNLPSD